MDSGTPTLIIGGQARLPKELSPGTVLQLVVELDQKENKVIDVSCSPCVPVVEKALKCLILGVNLETDLDIVLAGIEKRIIHRGKKAMSTAFKDLVREYKEFKNPTAPPSNSRAEEV